MSSLQQDLALLGLPATATLAEIKAAFRSMSRDWHPDRFQEPQAKQTAEAKFKEISLAYSRLRDYAAERVIDPTQQPAYVNEKRHTTLSVYTDESLKQQKAETYLAQGLAYAKDGRYEAAIAEYTKAINLQPDYIEAYQARGFARSALGLEKTADSDLNKARLLERAPQKDTAKSQNRSQNRGQKHTNPSQKSTSKSASSKPSPNPQPSPSTTALVHPLDPPWQPTISWAIHPSPILAMVASRDGRLLFSSGADRSLQIWNLKKGQFVYQFPQPVVLIHGLALSRDEQLLVGYDSQNTIYIWNVGSFWNSGEIQLLRTIPSGFQSRISAIALSPDRRLLVAGDESGYTGTWQIKDGRRLRIFQEEGGAILALTFNGSGQCWITSSASGQLKVRQIETYVVKQTLAIPDLIITTMALSPNGRWLAVGGSVGQLHLLPQLAGQFSQTLGGHTTGIQQVLFLSTGELVSVSKTGEIALWRLPDLALLSRFQSDLPLTAVATTKSNLPLITAHTNGSIRIWQPTN